MKIKVYKSRDDKSYFTWKHFQQVNSVTIETGEMDWFLAWILPALIGHHHGNVLEVIKVTDGGFLVRLLLDVYQVGYQNFSGLLLQIGFKCLVFITYYFL